MSKTEKLVSKAKNGNQNAFTKLYELTKNEVWFTCLSLANNEENAKDIMQDTYITAFLKINSIDDNSKFSGWIKRIAVNKSKDFLKSRVDCQLNEEVIMDLIETDEIVLPEEYITQNEKRRIILQLMEDTLSVAQYQTVFMHYFDNMTVSEIAEVFDCPEGTVMSRLSLARTKMKKAVTDYEAKNNDKLHSVAVLPLFSEVFKVQSKSLKVPKIHLTLPANASQGGVSVLSKETESVVKATGKGFLSTLKFKAIATACAVALVSGGIATAVVLANSDNAVENVATESLTVEKTVADAIMDSELTVDEDDNITDEKGNKLVADENGEVEVKTDDGKTVKVSEETVKTVNKGKGTTNTNTSTEKKNTSTNTTSSKSSTSTSTSKSTSTSNTSKGSTTNTSSSKTSSSTSSKTTSSKSGGTTSSKTSSNTNSNKNTNSNTNSNPHAGKTWHEAEYKTVNHPAETQKVWVVDQEAYTYEEPIYENQRRAICNTCGADITANLDDGTHGMNHIFNGENFSYSVKTVQVQTGTKTVTVPEEGHWETKVVKEAWTEKVLVKEAGWY